MDTPPQNLGGGVSPMIDAYALYYTDTLELY